MAPHHPHGRHRHPSAPHLGRVPNSGPPAHAAPNSIGHWDRLPDDQPKGVNILSPAAYSRASSSPPRQVAPRATTEPEQEHRTSVTTSPCLTDKRRSRSTDDRSIAQQQHKEQQIATKRLTRRSQQAPAPDPNACCNRFCTLLTPPTMSDGGICRATQRIMHSACRSPCRLSETAGYCRSCSPATETPAP